MKKTILKIIRRICIAILILLLGLIVFVTIICPINNNFKAKEIVDEMKALQLPEDTQFVEGYSNAGKLCGNGNGMQYFGALLVKSELSLEELKDYYSQYDANDTCNVVEHQIGSEIKQIENQMCSFETDVVGDNFYIIYTWGDYNGISSEFDLRGN